jgi:hypothetical protein
LENTSGVFKEVNGATLPDSGYIGMITDAHWVTQPATRPHLVVVGEWMRLRIFSWYEDHFEEDMIPGLENSSGMWNIVIPADIDRDGDIDLIAGNIGKNIKYNASPDKPFKMFVNDFDGDGTPDIYPAYCDRFDGKYYPVWDMDYSSKSLPFIKSKFRSYTDFASAAVEEILDGKMEGAEELTARTFESGIFENIGTELIFHPFKHEAQMSPIHGIVISDFNEDGIQDIFMTGNFYHREPLTTRSDAGVGNLLLGNGGMSFDYVHPSHTGILANKDARSAGLLKTENARVIVIANNSAPLQFYEWNKTQLKSTVQ